MISRRSVVAGLVASSVALPFSRPAFAAKPSRYLGIVATRLMAPVASIPKEQGTWAMSRSMHFARENLTAITLRFPNFFVGRDNAETVLGDGTIKASVEYPIGKIVPCVEGRMRLSGGLVSLSCTVAIPKGAQFWVRTLQVNQNGIVFSGINNNWFDPTEGLLVGTGKPNDLTSGGVIPPAAHSSQCYGPISIVGWTRQPSIAINGDSRALGIKDVATDASCDTGEIARSLGPVFGYVKLASGGTSVTDFLKSHKFRDIVNGDASHVIDAYGANDLSVHTPPKVAEDRAAFASAYPNRKVIGTTLTPVTDSSDKWATLEGQSKGKNDGGIAAFNELVRNGIKGEIAYFDLARALDPRGDGKWPVNGAPFYSTPDGLHGNENGNRLIAASGLVNPNLITNAETAAAAGVSAPAPKPKAGL